MNLKKTKQKKNPHQPDTIIKTTSVKGWLVSHVLKRLLVTSNFCLTRGNRSLKVKVNINNEVPYKNKVMH